MTDTWTTPEVAALLGISSAGVRQLVHRGRLHPVRGGGRPLRFRWLDVERLRVSRTSAVERSRLDAATERFLTC